MCVHALKSFVALVKRRRRKRKKKQLCSAATAAHIQDSHGGDMGVMDKQKKRRT